MQCVVKLLRISWNNITGIFQCLCTCNVAQNYSVELKGKKLTHVWKSGFPWINVGNVHAVDFSVSFISLRFSNPLSKPEKAVYPDTVAVALDTVNQRVRYLRYYWKAGEFRNYSHYTG